MNEPITEDWLKENGFRWETVGPHKHWLLWMGRAVSDRSACSSEDLGIELAVNDSETWFCWIRADYCGRYTRFVHVRHLRHIHEVTDLIAALTGFPFDLANSMYGAYHKPETAARLRADADRLEVRLAEQWGQRAIRETGQDKYGRDKVRP